jgi:hypothetical protein
VENPIKFSTGVGIFCSFLSQGKSRGKAGGGIKPPRTFLTFSNYCLTISMFSSKEVRSQDELYRNGESDIKRTDYDTFVYKRNP